MKYIPEDLEIFILTYNRAKFLEETLTSLLNQSAKGFRIVVLDNASTDNTVNIIKKYENQGVEFFRSDINTGSKGNFQRAQEMANRKWSMAFHDDDIMHPDYIKTALEYINKLNNPVLIASQMDMLENPTNENWQNLTKKAHYFKNISEFASFLYVGKHFNYSSSIYRTDLFKVVQCKDEIYGKIVDKPIIMNIAEHGETAILAGNYIRYRVHSGQDSNANKNGPFVDQVIALNKKFHKIMGHNIFKLSGRIFLAYNYKWLINGYSWCKTENNTITLDDFIKKALENNAGTKHSIWYGKNRRNLIMLPFRIINEIHIKNRFKIIDYK